MFCSDKQGIGELIKKATIVHDAKKVQRCEENLEMVHPITLPTGLDSTLKGSYSHLYALHASLVELVSAYLHII